MDISFIGSDAARVELNRERRRGCDSPEGGDFAAVMAVAAAPTQESNCVVAPDPTGVEAAGGPPGPVTGTAITPATVSTAPQSDETTEVTKDTSAAVEAAGAEGAASKVEEVTPPETSIPTPDISLPSSKGFKDFARSAFAHGARVAEEAQPAPEGGDAARVTDSSASIAKAADTQGVPPPEAGARWQLPEHLTVHEQTLVSDAAGAPAPGPRIFAGDAVSKAAEVVSALRAEKPAAPSEALAPSEPDEAMLSESGSVERVSAAGATPEGGDSARQSLGERSSDGGDAQNRQDTGNADAGIAAGGAQTVAGARHGQAVEAKASGEEFRHVAAQLAAGAAEVAREVNVRGGSRTVRLRLRPEELGAVEITIKSEGAGRVSAHLSAERETTSRSLSDGLANLHEALQKAGVELAGLHVAHGVAAGGASTQGGGQTDTGAAAQVARFEAATKAAGPKAAGPADEGAERLLSVRA